MKFLKLLEDNWNYLMVSALLTYGALSKDWGTVTVLLLITVVLLLALIADEVRGIRRDAKNTKM